MEPWSTYTDLSRPSAALVLHKCAETYSINTISKTFLHKQTLSMFSQAANW